MQIRNDQLPKVDSSGEDTQKMPRAEYGIAMLIFIIGIFLRIVYVFHYPFDSDEPQHLHVVWAWTRGYLQYRDVFDNHTPLFHILFNPVLHIIGERSSALYIMRLTMIPLLIIGMVCTYIIGRNLYFRRVGIWSVALVSVYPAFFFCSLQFRPDVLWMVLWFAGLAVVLSRPLTPRRTFFAGLLFGSALCVSIKTTLLLFSLAISVGFVLFMNRKYYKNFSEHRLFAIVGSASIGFIIIPTIIIAFFAIQGALGSLFYCIVSHNILPRLGHWKEPWRIYLFLVLLPIIFLINRIFIRSSKEYTLGALRSIVFLTVLMYFLSLFTFWPFVARQNFLPVYSLVGILVVPELLKGVDWCRSKCGQRSILRFCSVSALMLISVFEIIVIFLYNPPWKDYTKKEIALIEEVLKLTNRNDWVFDEKGESVFRPRPFYYVFEKITTERMFRRLIPDTIAEQLIAKRCCVVISNVGRFLENTYQFIEENYISVGQVRVAGKFLEPSLEEPNVVRFEVCIPTYYVIVGEGGVAEGTLDNSPYVGVRFLKSGIHEFVFDTEPQRLALVWAQAAERGFSPFSGLHFRDEE